MAREINPEVYFWNSRLKTNFILADIWDLLSVINTNLVAIGSRQKAKKAPTYPRPENEDSKEHYGKDAVSVPELKEFFTNKRKKRMQNDGK